MSFTHKTNQLGIIIDFLVEANFLVRLQICFLARPRVEEKLVKLPIVFSWRVAQAVYSYSLAIFNVFDADFMALLPLFGTRGSFTSNFNHLNANAL